MIDAGIEATDHVTILFRAGYQARFSTDGGPTLGAKREAELWIEALKP